MAKNKENFNIVISGIGGQGLITLLQIIAKAALLEARDVKTSELHGLSQRGGSVEVHIRIGKEIYSPLVSLARADLILGLEMLEALRMVPYANSKTFFLINKSGKQTAGKLKGVKLFVPASEICKRELGKEVLAGVYLLSLAAHKKLIPLKPESVLKAIISLAPKKYLELNKRAFELAKT